MDIPVKSKRVTSSNFIPTFFAVLVLGFIPAALMTLSNGFSGFVNDLKELDFDTLYIKYLSALFILMFLVSALSIWRPKYIEEYKSKYQTLFNVLNKTGTAFYGICSMLSGMLLFAFLYALAVNPEVGFVVLFVMFIGSLAFFIGAIVFAKAEELVLSFQK